MATLKKYNLSYEAIDSVCRDIDAYCKETRVFSKEALRMRLIAEETLLQYRDIAPEDTVVEIVFSKSMFKAKISMNIYCESHNPFASEEEGVMKSLVGGITDKSHSWKYIKGIYNHLINGESRNTIEFKATRNKKINNPVLIVICLVIGLVLALILRSIVPAAELLQFNMDYILPLTNAYTGLLCVMAILLIFFSIPLCMVQYGNGVAFQKDINRLLGRFLLVSSVLVLLTFLYSFLSFGMTGESNGFGAVFKPIFDVFISFIPGNLVNPFLNFNCMQVLIIGALFGVAFLVMGDDAKGMVKAFDKLNLVAVITNGYLAKLVGIYSGLMVFYFVSTNSGAPGTVIWIVATTLVISIIAYFTCAIVISLKLKVKLSVVIKKFLPSFLINLSSASIGASFIVFFDELAKDSGVEVNYTAVGCNIGSVLFKPIYSVFFAATGFMIAAGSGGISPGVALQIIVLSLVLPMAIPNVPGGASPIIIIFLSSLGFSGSYSDTVISINSLLQFLIVPFNIFILQCIIVLQASKHNKINLEKLREYN